MMFAPLKSENRIQAKLTVGQPNDRYEQQADRVADQVVAKSKTDQQVQRKCTDCEEEAVQMKPINQDITPIQRMGLATGATEEEEKVQMKGFSNQGGTSAGLENKIQQNKGKGTSLPDSTRQQMEQGIGADFSGVRVHTGNEAIQMNHQLNARAFTTGSDIYFNSGQFQPQSQAGQHLLAHELTHVVQQSHGAVPAIQKTDWGLLGGKGCNESGSGPEWALVGEGTWQRLDDGDCTSSFTDCDGMTCGGGFYYISNFQTGICRTPRVDDSTFRDRRWTPSNPNRPDAMSPTQRGGQSDVPPGYQYDNEGPA